MFPEWFTILFTTVTIQVRENNPAMLPGRITGTIVAAGGRADDGLDVVTDGVSACQVHIRSQAVHCSLHAQVPTVIFKGWYADCQ